MHIETSRSRTGHRHDPRLGHARRNLRTVDAAPCGALPRPSRRSARAWHEPRLRTASIRQRLRPRADRQLPPALWLGWSLGGLVVAVRGHARTGSCPRPCAGCRVAALRATPSWPHGIAPDVLKEFATGLQQNHRATIERFLALETLGSDHPRGRTARPQGPRVRTRRTDPQRAGAGSASTEGRPICAATSPACHASPVDRRAPRPARPGGGAALVRAARRHGRFIELPSGMRRSSVTPARSRDSIDAFARESSA